MRQLISFVLSLIAFCTVSAQTTLMTESDSINYSAGMMIGQMMKETIDMRTIPAIKSDLKDCFNESIFYQGVIALLKGDESVLIKDSAISYFHHRVMEIREAQIAATKKEGADFLEKNAKTKGIKVLPSGLQYKVLVKGNGAIPTKDDTCIVKYEGRLINGNVFDSSYKRNPQTTEFTPSQVIKGWTEALTMMPVGSKWQLFIPQELAYGERETGEIPPYSTLIFDVELVSIKVKKD